MALSASRKMTTAGNLHAIREFIGMSQRSALFEALKGEEAVEFADMIDQLHARIDTMPVTYEQDGKGDEAIVYLHYFHGGFDWYITEKDMSGEGHPQAFGLASMGGWPELGYINIEELIHHGVELDLYFDPTTLGEIKKKLMAA